VRLTFIATAFCGIKCTEANHYATTETNRGLFSGLKIASTSKARDDEEKKSPVAKSSRNTNAGKYRCQCFEAEVGTAR